MAKNLKNRVASYFKNSATTLKQQAMVAKIAAVELYRAVRGFD
jgi:excinuclease UvrABC nuclease subunit